MGSDWPGHLPSGPPSEDRSTFIRYQGEKEEMLRETRHFDTDDSGASQEAIEESMKFSLSPLQVCLLVAIAFIVFFVVLRLTA